MSRLRVIAAAAAIGLGLGGCGIGNADVAAKVDGRVITEDAARTAAEQINQAFTPDQPLTMANAIDLLISSGSVLEVAEAKGQTVTVDAALAALAGKVENPTPETIDLLRANAAWNMIGQDPQAPQALAAALDKKRISVNPRFGTYDKEQLTLAPAAPNWIADTT
ncbi:MAG: hypothetical protein V9G19_22770 [Tetrasphaera sp.]